MAYVCNNCRRAAERKYANCPTCGCNLHEDNRSIEELETAGYRIIGKRATTEQPPVQEATAVPFTIDDTDLLARLRRGYREAQAASTRQTSGEQPQQPVQEHSQETSQDFFGSYNGTTSQPQTERPRRTEQPARSETEEPGRRPSRSQDGGFFAQYQNTTAATQNEVQASREPPQPAPVPPPVPPERIPRNYRFSLSDLLYGFGNFFHAIPWRVVFTLLIIGLVIGTIAYIWSMRYAIVSGLLGFFIELLPIALIIGGCVWLLRSLFR